LAAKKTIFLLVKENRQMRGHLLGDFETVAVFEVGGDASGAEGVTTDLALDAGPCDNPTRILTGGV
jgi:hypothetical protein